MNDSVVLYGPRGERVSSSAGHGRTDNLIKAATQNSNRTQIPLLDHDIHRNVSNLGRRTIMTLGRWIYFNFAEVRGVIREQAEYSSSIFMPQFIGKNKEWGKKAEKWIKQNDRVCDVAGWPYNMRLYRRNLIIAVKRDGDALTVLVTRGKGKNAQPRLQLIPAHRIGSRYDETIVMGGPYDGARIIDGVIIDDAGAALAYRVTTGENPYDYSQFVDIPATQAFLSFDPDFAGAVRGLSPIGVSGFDWQDVKETKALELLAQKLNAGIALTEDNASGTAINTARHALTTPAATDTTPRAGVASESVTIDGIQVRYFKANSGAGIKAHISDRPTPAQQQFQAGIVRSNFHGMDWSVDFSDPTQVGGAPLRVVVERINRSVLGNQDIILEPAMVRYNGFRLGVAMMVNGELPFEPEWPEWAWQAGPQLTADKKYDSEIDQQEAEMAFQTDAMVCAKRGAYNWDNYDVKERETTAKMEAAERLVARFGGKLSLVEAYNLMWKKQPNGVVSQAQPGKQSNDNGPANPEL